MPRIRSIKPEYFTDADLCELSSLHRILFAGLWCHQDREGRCEDKPRELKVKILPYDDCDVDAMLWDLTRSGFILRYEVAGRRFLATPKFAAHQHPHLKETASTIPGPDTPGARTVPDPKPCPSLPAKAASLPESSPPSPVEPAGLLSSGAGSGHSSSSPPPPPEDDVEAEFWHWAQLQRSDRGLAREPSAPQRLAQALLEAKAEGLLGSFSAAYLRYLDDHAFSSSGWPMGVFVSPRVWRPRAHLRGTPTEAQLRVGEREAMGPCGIARCSTLAESSGPDEAPCCYTHLAEWRAAFEADHPVPLGDRQFEIAQEHFALWKRGRP